jgi:hypothetical protein
VHINTPDALSLQLPNILITPAGFHLASAEAANGVPTKARKRDGNFTGP